MKKILVVDDEPGVLMSAKMLLQDDYEIDTESDPDKAEEKAKQNNYDVIFMDITMPKRSGIDVVKNMRAQGVKSPIYIISGWAGADGMIDEAKQQGVNGYFEKPLTLEKVKEALGEK